MLSKRALAAGLLAVASGLSYGQQGGECVALAKVIGLEIVRSSASSDRLSIQKYDFCQKEYSTATETEKKSIEANYGAVGGKGAAEKSSIQEKQKEVCENRFGLEYAKSKNANDSQRMNESAGRVIESCLKDKVRIVDASFAGNVVKFTVLNSTDVPVTIRRVVVTPPNMAEPCDVANDERGFFGSQSIPVLKSVDVTCALKGRDVVAGDASQRAYGGGFLSLDIPKSTVTGIYVPTITEPSLTKVQRELQEKLQAAEAAKAAMQVERDAAIARATAAEAATEKVRVAAKDAQDSAAKRVHVFTNGYGQPLNIRDTPRIYVGESVGISAVSNWGLLAADFAAKTCGGAGKFSLDTLSTYHGGPGGFNVGTFVCKVDIP